MKDNNFKGMTIKNVNNMTDINFKEFLKTIDNNLNNTKVLNINDFNFS